jgi:hypothetical protein
MLKFRCQVVEGGKETSAFNIFVESPYVFEAAKSAALSKCLKEYDFIEGTFDPEHITEREAELLLRPIAMLYLNQVPMPA